MAVSNQKKTKTSSLHWPLLMNSVMPQVNALRIGHITTVGLSHGSVCRWLRMMTNGDGTALDVDKYLPKACGEYMVAMRNVLVVYRILYGTDYLERSIRSVLAGSDQVFVGYSNEPWSRPKPFADIREIEVSPREVIDQHFDDKVTGGQLLSL